MLMIKKAVPVECLLWDGTEACYEEIKNFAGANVCYCTQTALEVKTPHGNAICDKGDYIFKGGANDFYPVKASFVAENYKPVEEGVAQSAPIPAVGFDIGTAIEHMRNGCKVQRAGWNGKGMFIVIVPALMLPPFSSQHAGAKVNDRTARHIGVDTPLDSQPYIAMWTADKKWQPGWLCSQADLLATDWQLV